MFASLPQNSLFSASVPHGKAQVIIGWKGLNIAIECQPGDVRHNRIMSFSYGHLQNYIGADGEALDVYLGVKPASDKIYQIDQLKLDGTFDEHKFMLWFATLEEAQMAYLISMPSQFFWRYPRSEVI